MSVITAIRWQTYRLPFAARFTTAHGMMASRAGAIITITTAGGMIGIGEIAPLPEFGGENLGDALDALEGLASKLKGMTIEEALAVMQDRVPSPHNPSVHCGIETALLDALGKIRGCSIANLLILEVHKSGWEPRATVPVNTVIGETSLPRAVGAAQEAKRQDFRCVKLKVGNGSDVQQEVERIAAVRAAIGPAIHLRLDANEAWDLGTAITILEQCLPYDIQYVEQPLKREDLKGMRTLRQYVPIAIAADEALHDRTSAHLIMDNEAADVLIIKPQLIGGLRAAQQIIHEATKCGIQCVVTTTIESAISLVAALHLVAVTPDITLESGLATNHLLADDLICEHLPLRDGSLTLPGGPGLGVTLDKDALEHYHEHV